MSTTITSDNIDSASLSTLVGSTPVISNIIYTGDDTATIGNETITLTGSGFETGAVVYIQDVPVATTVVDSNTITFTSPTKPTTRTHYTLVVINPDGNWAKAMPGLLYSVFPAWGTAAGSLGNVYETNSYSFNLATGTTSDSTVRYTIESGSLPTDGNLSIGGTISGTATALSSSTTYSFTVGAEDQENQNISRNYSITVNPDVVTFTNPASNPLAVSTNTSTAYSLTLAANSAAGKSISYSIDSLPAGISLTSGVLSGTPATPGTYSTLVTATAATTNRTATRTFNWSIAAGPGQEIFTTATPNPTTIGSGGGPYYYQWVCPAGVTSISVVCVGAGAPSYGTSQLGGGGGALAYVNNVSVTPGVTYYLQVGKSTTTNGSAGARTSSFGSGICEAQGGSASVSNSGNNSAGGVIFGSGSRGGTGGNSTATTGGGGGGAGGYSGLNVTGGGNGQSTTPTAAATAGTAGGGGGGNNGLDGGGVGIFGQGANGGVGAPGSGGTGMTYGGGAGGIRASASGTTKSGGDGVVRIVWPGTTRQFPSTNVATATA